MRKRVTKVLLSVIFIIWIASEIFNYINYRNAVSVEIKGSFKRTHKYQLVIARLFFDVFPSLGEKV